jgi:hypothetical protein
MEHLLKIFSQRPPFPWNILSQVYEQVPGDYSNCRMKNEVQVAEAQDQPPSVAH